MHGAAGGGLYRPVWHTAAALGTEPKDDRNAIEVDGRAAYAAADIPLLEVEGRPAAPDGYEGVTATVGLDQRTGDRDREPRPSGSCACNGKCRTASRTPA